MKDTREEEILNLIETLGVFELRGLARQLGVVSPTTKKREELLVLIKEAIVKGEYKKDLSPKRGRPFKPLNILDTISDKLVNERICIDFENRKKDFTFNQDEAQIMIEYSEFEGIVEKNKSEIEMRDIATDALAVFDKNNQIDELLQVGDKVKVGVVFKDDVFYVNRIIEINDEPYETYRSRFVRKGIQIISNEKIDFLEGNAIVGRRNIYKLKEEIFETNMLENLINFCKDEKYELIILATNTSFENEIKLDQIVLSNKFVTVYGTDEAINYHKVINSIIYAENLMNRGKKVILFVADIMEVYKSLSAYFYDKDFNNEAIKLIMNKLLEFAHAYDTGISGTIIMCYNEIDQQNSYLSQDLMKICNKIN